MTQLSKEILAYSRACEHLLSTEITLNDDESSLVEYYIKEVSRKLVSLELTQQSGGTTTISKPELRDDQALKNHDAQTGVSPV
jgi:hypothetical protein